MVKKADICISGIGGIFPESNSLDELQEKLLNGENLVKNKPRSVPDPEHPYVGNVLKSNEFDARFFKIHEKLNEILDYHLKMLLQRTFEAICDAGVNPSSLRSSKTLVAISGVTGDSEMSDGTYNSYCDHTMLASSRAMNANRISYVFELTGPSYTVEASWVGALSALEMAVSMIQHGHVQQAIVGVPNLIKFLSSDFHYGEQGLGFLTKGDCTKSFSADADGYNRAEAVVVFFIQKEDLAFRSYGTIEKIMTSHNSSPDIELMGGKSKTSEFLENVYEANEIDVNDIAYVECDGSAIPVIDKIELDSIDKAIAKKRKSPLLVGSCKSMTGHTEAASCFLGIVNAVIAFRSGYIPPTINYVKNTGINGIAEGRIKVVSEKTPLQGDYIAVNVLGISSLYGHVILKRPKNSNTYKTINRPEGIPLLVQISGRDDELLSKELKRLTTSPVDDGQIALVHNIFKENVHNHLLRGFTILEPGEGPFVQKCDIAEKPKLWFVFSGMGSQWPEMGRDLMKFPVAAESLRKSHEVLLPEGVNLFNIITSKEKTIFDDILNAFVGITSIQVALVDLLRSVGVTPDGIVGHSMGELGCAYADGCLTAKEVVLSSCARGRAANEAKLIKGMMAAVGRGYADIKDLLPPDIEVACHNSQISSTLSGPTEVMKEFTETLKKKGIFVKLVNVANVAYHSKHVAPAGPYLLKRLKKIITSPKKRSSKWISSSVPEDKWDSDLAKYCSAEYQTNNLLSYVLFEEACAHIPKDCIYIEIAPHGLLQSILRKTFSEGINVALTNRFQENNAKFLLKALGNLYANGVQMDLGQLYPYEFPVPASTKNIQPIITWMETSHSALDKYISSDYLTVFERIKVIDKFIMDFGKSYKQNYLINNTFCLPVTMLLDHILINYEKVFKHQGAVNINDLNFQQFMDVDMFKDTEKDVTFIKFSITKEFIIDNNGGLLVQGLFDECSFQLPSEDPVCSLCDYDQQFCSEEVILQMAESGMNLKSFKNLRSVHVSDEGFFAVVKASKEWFLTLDSVFSLLNYFYLYKFGEPYLIWKIRSFSIDLSLIPTEGDFTIMYEVFPQELKCRGIWLLGPKMKPLSVKNCSSGVELRKQMFIPFSRSLKMSSNQFYHACAQFIGTNVNISSLKKGEANLIDLSNNIETPKDFKVAMEINSHLKIFSITTSQEQLGNIEVIPHRPCSIVCYEGSKIPNEIMNLLENKDNYLLYFTNSKAATESKDLVVIYEVTLDKKRVLLVKRASSNLNKSNIINANKTNWETTLVEKLYETSDPVFLVMQYQSLTDVMSTLKSMHQSNVTCNLRMVYIDNSCPEFNMSNPFYKDQLRKDFKVNICQQGVWGCVNLVPIEENHFESMEKVINLNSVTCSDVNLKYITPNLDDPEQISESAQLGTLEYSGTKGKDEIFGISKMPQNNIIEVDSILQWKKPKQWNHGEAATVPLFYTLAYYMITVISKLQPEENILVFSGFSNMGQAVIRVALSVGANVYTTYKTKEEKAAIQKLFPKMKEENIIQATSGSCLIQLAELTKGSWVQVVVNTSDDEMCVNMSFDVLSQGIRQNNIGPTYFMLNKTLLENNSIFGMKVFIHSTSMYGINTNQLFFLPNNKKKELAAIVEAGIKSGVVKPFTNITSEGTILKEDAINLIRDSNKVLPPKKVVLKVGENKSSSRNNNKDNVVVIGNYSNMVPSLLNWLSMNNAGEIHLVVNRDHIPSFLMRKNQRQKKLQLYSTSILQLSDQIGKFLQGAKQRKDIDYVYFISNGLEDFEDNLTSALKKHAKSASLICVGDNAGRLSERQQKEGLTSVGINHNLYDCKTLCKAFELATSKKSNDLMVIINDLDLDTSLDLSSILPSSLKEIMDGVENPAGSNCFVEIDSRSLPYSINKTCNPVFVIPGFNVQKINQMASQLIYPVFVARLPLYEDSLENLALSLAKELESNFNKKLFNLICEGWSGPLTFLVAKHLEMRGKRCNIFMIDIAPFVSKDLLPRINNVDIVLNYLNLSNESLKHLRDCKNMKEITSYLAVNDLPSEDKEHIVPSLLVLSKKMSLLQQIDFKNLEISSNVIHLLTDQTSIEELNYLKEVCKNIILYKKFGCSDSLSLMECANLRSVIAEMCLYETPYNVNETNIMKQTCILDHDSIFSLVCMG